MLHYMSLYININSDAIRDFMKYNFYYMQLKTVKIFIKHNRIEIFGRVYD